MQEERTKFITIIIVLLAAAYIVAPMAKKWPVFVQNAEIKLGIDLAGGAELTYRVLYPPGFKGSKEATTAEALAVLQRRIQQRDLDAKLTTQGNDQIVIQLPGVDRSELESFKELLKKVGMLELKAVATKDIHEQYNTTKKVPDGYEAYPTTDSFSGDYAYIKGYILTHKAAVITGQDIPVSYTHPTLPTKRIV